MSAAELKKTVLYLRVSTAGQTYTIQEDALREYCAARGWKEADLSTVRERGSGASKSRPELERILTEARQGRVKTVVVYKMDRLGRSVSHLSWVVAELNRMGVALICTSQGIDTSQDNPMARFVVNAMAGFAEMERDIIRERVKLGLQSAKKRGSVLGRPSIRESHRADVERLRKKGKTYLQIAKELEISETTAFRLGCKVSVARPVKKFGKVIRPRKFRVSKSSPHKQSNLALEA